MTLTTFVAAKQGPIPMAGHQICMQVWLSISLLTDALALAGQVRSYYLTLDYKVHLVHIYNTVVQDQMIKTCLVGSLDHSVSKSHMSSEE